MKTSDMIVLAAQQEPGTWHGDGTHAAVVSFDGDSFLVRNGGDLVAYDLTEQAAEAHKEAWRAEDARNRQANRTARLDSLAQQAGFETWRRLETAALAGDAVIVAK